MSARKAPPTTPATELLSTVEVVQLGLAVLREAVGVTREYRDRPSEPIYGRAQGLVETSLIILQMVMGGLHPSVVEASASD